MEGFRRKVDRKVRERTQANGFVCDGILLNARSEGERESMLGCI